MVSSKDVTNILDGHEERKYCELYKVAKKIKNNGVKFSFSEVDTDKLFEMYQIHEYVETGSIVITKDTMHAVTFKALVVIQRILGPLDMILKITPEAELMNLPAINIVIDRQYINQIVDGIDCVIARLFDGSCIHGDIINRHFVASITKKQLESLLDANNKVCGNKKDEDEPEEAQIFYTCEDPECI